MDLNNKNLWIINISGVEVWITETIVNTWIIMLMLVIFAAIVRIKLRKFAQVPTGFQNVIEAVVETFDNFVKNCAGEKLAYLGNWFFMVFAFILISNFSGLMGLRPPTADWATTFAFAFSTLMLIQIVGTAHNGVKYLKSFFEPNPLFLPLNLIGELSRPISLSFRLFGNIFAGMIFMSLVYTLLPVYLRLAMPVVLHVYFDLFCGTLQTYIFCALSLTFIGATSSD